METPTGIRFVLLSDLKVDSLTDELAKLYAIYVDTVIRNPLYVIGTPIKAQQFVDGVQSYIAASKHFK